MSNCLFLDSETFQYDAEDSHQGRHSILRSMLARPMEPGNYLMTVQGDTYYIWEVDGKAMRWIQWSQCEIAPIEEKFLQLERENICDIQPGHDGFYVCMNHVLLLGTEIEITPRSYYSLGDDAEKWTVDLTIPTGSETCTFYVFGKERIGWMARHARFDEPLIIALRKFKFKEVAV